MKFRVILKRINITAIIFSFVLSIYLIGLFAAEGISDIRSEEIEGLENLKEILEEEKLKLVQCRNYDISIKIINDNETPYATKIYGDKFEIGLYQISNISTIRHELYHIEDGHTDMKTPKNLKERFHNGIKYLFVYEPQAAIYELTGLKL